jgi:Mn2+/Fe2+ NRAMP family transporter
VTFRKFLETRSAHRERSGTPEDRGKVLVWRDTQELSPRGLQQRLVRLGPGLVTGIADVDPALVITATVAGAAYGHSLLWVVPLCIPFLITIFAVSARIGHQTERGLVDLLREHYGRAMALSCAAIIMVVNLAMIIAGLLAVSEALALIFQQRHIFFVAAVAFSLWYILIFRDYYKTTQRLVWLSLPLLVYVAAGVMAISDPRLVVRRTFFPTVMGSPDYLLALIAVMGSLLTPYVLVWQTSSRREQALLGARAPYGPGHHAGGLVPAVISYFVLLTAAEVLHQGSKYGIDFRGAGDALAPLDEIGPLLFALGIIGAGMVALPILIASMCYSVAEAMGWRSGLSEKPWDAKWFYVLISVTVFGAAAANFFRINPVGALYWSQVLAGVLTIPILLFILLLSNDRRIMRTTNTAIQNFWIGAALGCLISAGVVVLLGKVLGF